MKKCCLAIVCVLFSGLLFAAGSKKSNVGYGTSNVFAGAEVGFGGYGSFNLGVVGGYQHYFKSEWQFMGFRHGIRGIGTINWLQNSAAAAGLFMRLGADWTLEFNPQDRFVGGIFLGPSLGFIAPFNGLATNFVFSGNIGGSLNIDNTHRIELSLGAFFYVASFRYTYMF
ncbi:MAG: hypothetical protein MR025_06630 [Helicobacter trogontum]|uniref:Outer membrane beta-barrel protein n=1 Tax=Helicobacter trogontum TaxID=50960 RepID=A0A4U8TD52_9HELI|nr:hypothetical protein [Helicobacter trogontum]MCI5787106.1 hypothetical protein [Helicobacter trogontum]TLD97926.1 hypothetical protein LS80_006775 [Helicobacter trogontum]